MSGRSAQPPGVIVGGSVKSGRVTVVEFDHDRRELCISTYDWCKGIGWWSHPVDGVRLSSEEFDRVVAAVEAERSRLAEGD